MIPSQARLSSPAAVDSKGLSEELRRGVRGDVRFDSGSRALYSTDSSNYRQVPIGVVLPRDKEDVLAALEICRRHGAPILSRGAGTSLAGQCCNVAVILDFSRFMNRVLSIDPDERIATAEPGAILDHLRSAAAPYGLTFGPDPASHAYCTLGGMIGNDSCGVHSVMAAFAGTGPKTADQILELEIATYDGDRFRVGKTAPEALASIEAKGGSRARIYRDLLFLAERFAEPIRARFPAIPRRVSGYNLPSLLPENGFDVARALVGSEGTCVVVLEATVRLIESPKARSLLVIGFEDVFAAADRVPEVLEHRPTGLEGFDDRLVSDVRAVGLQAADSTLLPAGQGWLLVELGGDSKTHSNAKARALIDAMKSRGAVDARLYEDPKEELEVWRVRESGLGATAHVEGKPLMWEGWEDSAVAPEKLGNYLRDLRRLLDKHGYQGDFYGHFGQGCVHTRTDFDLQTRRGIDRYRAFLDEAADLVVSYGGSLSGEHGDGQSRAELLPRMFGPELIDAFRQFKTIWDPQGRMNPGKVVDAYPVDENLRLGPAYDPPAELTRFLYPADGGSWPRALLRCVGVGKCRRLAGGLMCPSFRVTREEEHSTRGRAHLLFEMTRGDTITAGWRSREVREALDLCLACKGCKKDCPVGVDVATYKAEFLSHYYEGRLRPRSAYAFGLIPWWVRIASLSPGLANFFTQTPGLAGVARTLAGAAADRSFPPFAAESFRTWFRRREAEGGRREAKRGRVLLFPDTFNDHFHPGTARAAVEVLEAAGFSVSIPRRRLCCGRPLYDYGMLGLARGFLEKILEELADDLSARTPIVVLEPSCAAVFRDELLELFPEEEAARKLARSTVLLSELLSKDPAVSSLRLSGRALLQTHCHQKSVLTVAPANEILARLGLKMWEPEEGCCGMAGAFGFETEHRDISSAIGEQTLLPAVREASSDTLLLADGFSCREQIRQATGRSPLHLAEVLHLAIRMSGSGESPGPLPEARYRERAARLRFPRIAGTLLGGGAAAAAAWGAARRRSR